MSSNNKNQENAFDTLGQQPEYTEEQKAAFDKIDYLIHKVFKQSQEGAELLEIWTEALKMTPTAQPGYDLLTIGIEEGKKLFIRQILTTIKKVEP